MTPISSTWKVQLKELWYRYKERRKEKCRLIELTQEESVIFLRVKMSDLNKRSAVIERYMESAKKNGVHECLAWPRAWSWFSSLRSQIVACLGYKRKKKKKKDSPEAVTIWNKQRAILEYFQDVPIKWYVSSVSLMRRRRSKDLKKLIFYVRSNRKNVDFMIKLFITRCPC